MQIPGRDSDFTSEQALIFAGTSLVTIGQGTLLLLKWLNVITWPWWLVLAPAELVALALLVFVCAVVWCVGDETYTREGKHV